MMKTLLSIDVDLVSSFAIRFACHLAKLIKMEIQPVYVKKPNSDGPATGAGWASRTWEREIIRHGRNEISAMIESEINSCPELGEPMVTAGERDAELLKIAGKEAFDLFMEGASFPWTRVGLHRRIHSSLYQGLRCPSVLVRSFREVQKFLLLLFEPAESLVLADFLRCFWSGCKIPLHLSLTCGEFSVNGANSEDSELNEAQRILEGAGCKVVVDPALPLWPEGVSAEALVDFGLVGTVLPRAAKKESRQLQWLERVSSPLLVMMR